mgnify:CR=1 FL=1
MVDTQLLIPNYTSRTKFTNHHESMLLQTNFKGQNIKGVINQTNKSKVNRYHTCIKHQATIQPGNMFSLDLSCVY